VLFDLYPFVVFVAERFEEIIETTFGSFAGGFLGTGCVTFKLFLENDYLTIEIVTILVCRWVAMPEQSNLLWCTRRWLPKVCSMSNASILYHNHNVGAPR